MLSGKLFNYFFWYFLATIVLFLLGFLVVIFLADFTDNLRKFSKFNVSILTIALLSLLNLPKLTIDVSVFIVLFASFFCIRSTVLKRELDIIKASGISIWQFLTPFIAVAIIWSFVIIFAVTSLSVFSINNYLAIESSIRSDNNKLNFKASGSNLWLIDRISPTHANIILAKDNKIKNNKSTLINVLLFEIISNQVAKIVQANEAIIENNMLILNTVLIKNNTSDYAESLDSLTINFNINGRVNSLSSPPSEVYIWNFPSMINNLDKVNLDSSSYKSYFYSLLLLPLLLISMILLSTSFSLYDMRSSKSIFPIVAMLVAGFLVYLFINIIGTVSISGIINPLYASILSYLIILVTTINLVFSKERL